MPNLTLTHSGNMNITNAYIAGNSLKVDYNKNNTGAVIGFTFTPEIGSEFVCGETYTITAVPRFSGTVLTENFLVSGVDIAGVRRTDTSTLRQGYDSNLEHYTFDLAAVGATIISSSITSTYAQVEIRIDNTDYAEIDFQTQGGAVITYPIDNISGDEPGPGPDTGVVATSITLVVDEEIVTSGDTSVLYEPSDADVEISYSISDSSIATIDGEGHIEVLQDGEVVICAIEERSGLMDCKTVDVYLENPDTGDTGDTGTVINYLELIVDDEIVENGVAVPVYSPATADTLFVFTSSDPGIATIGSEGNITVLDNGEVTFCVRDEISGLEDCKTVIVRKAVYIEGIELLVDDEIYFAGQASAAYYPTGATVSLVYSCSDPDIASINTETGEITTFGVGDVVICVRDRYTNLSDCKTVKIVAAGPEYYEYFTIEALGDGEIHIYPGIYYSVNDGEWATRRDVNDPPVYVVTGDKIRLKGITDNNTQGNILELIPTTGVSGNLDYGVTFNYKVYGNYMSLLYGDDFIGQYTLRGRRELSSRKILDASGLIFPIIRWGSNQKLLSVFENSINLTIGPAILPAPSVPSSGYRRMFAGCTSLIKAPEILAKTVSGGASGAGAFQEMFSGCTSLTYVPDLRITQLYAECCFRMFSRCTSLTSAPELPATTLALECYYQMFQNCTSLTQAPQLPATTLAGRCYYQMFQGCTSLVQAPELPATTLADDCYLRMFEGCTSLTATPELPATTLANACYDNMFAGCTSLTQAPSILPATTLVGSCYRGMFWGCTSLTRAPELPALTLANYCYEDMFNGCTHLNYIKCLLEKPNGTASKSNWVRYTPNSGGTFIKNPNTSYITAGDVADWTYFWRVGASGIPAGWTITDAT